MLRQQGSDVEHASGCRQSAMDDSDQTVQCHSVFGFSSDENMTVSNASGARPAREKFRFRFGSCGQFTMLSGDPLTVWV